jgi:hypothetical protein
MSSAAIASARLRKGASLSWVRIETVSPGRRPGVARLFRGVIVEPEAAHLVTVPLL